MFLEKITVFVQAMEKFTSDAANDSLARETVPAVFYCQNFCVLTANLEIGREISISISTLENRFMSGYSPPYNRNSFPSV